MKYQTAVLGSGPAGLTAAIYASRGGLKTALIGGQERGGQLMLTTEVENFPGFPEGILGPDLMERTIKQATKFGTEMIDDQVEKIEKKSGGFILHLISGQEVEAASVVVATGASAKWLGVPGEKELRGKGVSACATCDGFFFKDKVVTVVGGGDVAMEEASYLTKFASKVRIIHRRDAFRATKVMQDRVFNNPKIEIVWNSVVEAVLGKDKVEGLKVRNVKTGEVTQLPTDGLFVAIGHQPNTAFLRDLVAVDEKGYLITSWRLALEASWLEAGLKTYLPPEQIKRLKKEFRFEYPHITSVEGIWAAGDVADYRYQQAVTAAGSGCSAALEIMEWLKEKVK